MADTPFMDIRSAVRTIETTSFDSAENRAGREFLRGQMDDSARDSFDDAVTTLRASLAPMTPEDREAWRGFHCEIAPGDGLNFVVNAIPAVSLREVSSISGPGVAPRFGTPTTQRGALYRYVESIAPHTPDGPTSSTA
jgi:hypothetical protein